MNVALPSGKIVDVAAQATRRLLRKQRSVVAPVAVLVILLVTFSITSADFLTGNNMLNILSDSSVLLVLALASMTVILTGGIDLSIGSTLALSAFVGALLTRDTGTTSVLLMLPVVGLACGFVNGVVVAFGRLPSFLVTLGAYFVYDGVANYTASGQPVALPYPLTGAATWFTGDTGGFPHIFIWAFGALVAAFLVFRYTRIGRHIYALGSNEKTARMSGVMVERVKVSAFMISGLFAGVAGLLEVTRAQSASPEMGAPYLLPAIAAVVMGGTPLSGGIGGPLNCVVGVLVLAILGNGMVLAAVNPYIQVIIQGIVVVCAVAMTIDRQKTGVIK